MPFEQAGTAAAGDWLIIDQGPSLNMSPRRLASALPCIGAAPRGPRPSASAEGEDSMTSDEVRAFIERHADHWNRQDTDALCRQHAEDGVVVSPMFRHTQGRSQICDSYAALFKAFPDWRIRFGAPIIDGNRVAITFSVTATHQGEFMGFPGTGRRCEIEGVSLFELDADLHIKEERRVYDFTGLLSQLGVVRIKPAN
jgi:steroid delta-isomerase-like uncharacterized protein